MLEHEYVCISSSYSGGSDVCHVTLFHSFIRVIGVSGIVFLGIFQWLLLTVCFILFCLLHCAFVFHFVCVDIILLFILMSCVLCYGNIYSFCVLFIHYFYFSFSFIVCGNIHILLLLFIFIIILLFFISIILCYLYIIHMPLFVILLHVPWYLHSFFILRVGRLGGWWVVVGSGGWVVGGWTWVDIVGGGGAPSLLCQPSAQAIPNLTHLGKWQVGWQLGGPPNLAGGGWTTPL